MRLRPSGQEAGYISSTSKRRHILVVVAIVTAVLSVAGLALSTRIKSPAEAASEAGPPVATILTAPVERRVLSTTVVLRGKVSAAQRVEVTPASAVNSARLVITGVRVRPGATVRHGQVLAEVSARPVIALRGALPSYRDLKPGDNGRDVEQLQIALRLSGYQIDDVDGRFGSDTKRSLDSFYRQIGFDAALAGDPEAVKSARATVKAAERRLDAAVTQAAKSKSGSTPTADDAEVRYAREDLASARSALADAEASSGPMLPLSEVVYLPSFPARVVASTAVVGGEVKAPMMTLETGALRVIGDLLPADRGLVRKGLPVAIVAESNDLSAKGVVSSVGGDAEGLVRTVIQPSKPLPSQWSGQDVRLTITAAKTSGPVLIVPQAAVSAGADGRSYVFVLEAGDKRRRVPVRAGVSADGFVGVSPLSGGLVVGDQVVIG
jgi:peptidoglycan hydrolase-like protein with peptidoglycan-binding domain